MREPLATDDLAQNQLSAWRRDVLPLAHTLRAAEVAVVDHTLVYTPDGSAASARPDRDGVPRSDSTTTRTARRSRTT